MSWIIAFLSIYGQILNIKKNPQCFIVWGLANLAWIAYCIFKSEYAQALMFAVYLGFCIYGFSKWKSEVCG